MDRPIFIDNVLGLESATLREILLNLEATYCGTIGVQFMHIQDPEQKAWMQKTLENVLNQHFSFSKLLFQIWFIIGP